MGDLHLIKGGGGAGEQPGTVAQALKSAREQLNDENTEQVIIIALRKPYPGPLQGTLIWSAGDILRMIGFLDWAVLKIKAMVT